MSYAALMVPVDLGPTAADRVKLASHLAGSLKASLIGIAARPVPVSVGGHRGIADKTLAEDSDEEIAAAELRACEALFRSHLSAGHIATWRSRVASPDSYIIDQARAADLIVVSRTGRRDGDPGLLGSSTGTLLMEAGRPILVVPPNIDRVSTERIVIGWKNTKEARRAVADALPLLKNSTGVTVAAIGAEAGQGGVYDVVSYLSEHRIIASARIECFPARGVAETLLAIAAEAGAGVLVLGAYGHSRLREWVFGGVTADLLESTPICCLMSH